jgi:glycosyltransferase involved in cell wall biosynthesis
VRRFLYITPYFPPQSRVGALRPLKFARHLPDCGWAPLALCDLRPSDAMDRELERAVPDSTRVVRDYGPRARETERRYLAGELPAPFRKKSRKRRIGAQPLLPRALTPPPEWLPLGRHSADMPHALRAARGLLREGGLEAVVVNSDPYASLLVGLKVAREFDLPLISDLRDPWAPCALRRPRRPALQRRLVDRWERRVVEGSARVVLNTATALEDYRGHYPDLPAERFTFIRNHGDRELISLGEFAERREFTLLFLGRFRRFVEGGQLLRALAELRRRGLDGGRIKLVVSGGFPRDAEELAEQLGVGEMIEDHPFVPYRQVGSFMRSADLLVSLSHQTDQRIPAKTYDYLVSSRPMLMIADNPEIERIARSVPGVAVCPLDDATAAADAVQAAIERGRRREVDRDASGFDSATAARSLARILDEVTA